MDLELTPRPGYLSVRMTGRIDEARAVDLFDAVVQACARLRRTKALVDMRAALVTFDGNVPATFRMMRALAVDHRAALARSRDITFAILTMDRGSRPSLAGPIGRQQGLAVYVTDELLDAYAWLQVTPPEDADA